MFWIKHRIIQITLKNVHHLQILIENNEIILYFPNPPVSNKANFNTLSSNF